MKQFALGLLLSLFSFKAYTQFSCGFDATRRQQQNTQSAFSTRQQRTENALQNFIAVKQQMRQQRTSSGSIVYIPVVVHVMHTGGAVGSSYNPSATQITGALDYLNAVFDGSWTGSGGSILGVGDVQIRFVLATRDPANNPTTGINRVDASALAGYSSNGVAVPGTGGPGVSEQSVKNLSRWDPFKYYNIWLVNRLNTCDGISGCPSFYAGYAYFPYDNGAVSATTRDVDGTVMLASQMIAGQKTLPHEVGHALALYHPFEGEVNQTGANVCPPNSPTAGDLCADTNPITNPADDGAASPFSCRTGTSNCYSLPYNDNTELNFMNYTTCYRLFTANQRDRMQAAAAVTVRNSLATSWANGQGTYPVVFSAPVAAAVTPTSLLTNPNIAGIHSISLNGRAVYSLNATQDGGYVNNSNKWYNLFTLQRNTTYTMTVTVPALNDEQVGVWMDYNNNGSFTDAGEQILAPTNVATSASDVTLSFNFTTPNAAPGAVIRMRVIEDLSTIYGAPAIGANSASLRWGQAEDYPVYIEPGVLPLTLLNFEGAATEDAHLLRWNTSNETGMQRFVVEASADGQQFIPLGDVGANNQAGQHSYRFTHRQAGNSTWHYRLKMVNTDNSHSYSKTIRIDGGIKRGFTVSGNPFTENALIRLPVMDGAVTLRLLDLSGRQLERRQLLPGQQETFSYRVYNSHISAGVYLLEVTAGGQRFVQKLIKP